MKKDNKDKKSVGPKSVAKGATLAAMVAALGISLGTEVKNVYAQGNDLNSGSKLKLDGSLALKIDTGDTQEWKVDGSQQIKLTQSTSGKIVSISGNRVTILDANNKSFSWGVSLSSGGDAHEYLSSHYHVGDMISGKIVNGQLVIQDLSSR
jgi:hypothetical protein